jgi:hypothetical protein
MRIMLSATCLAMVISGTAVAEVTHTPAAGAGIGNPATTAPTTAIRALATDPIKRTAPSP